MRKLAITISSLFFAAVISSAQNLTIDKIAEYLDEYAVSMQVSFEVKSSEPVFGNAQVYIDGDGYIAKLEDYNTFYCDGKTRWTVDEATKEVYVENNDLNFDPMSLLSKASFTFDEYGWPTELSLPLNDDVVAVIRIKRIEPMERGTRKCALAVSELDKSYIVTDLR